MNIQGKAAEKILLFVEEQGSCTTKDLIDALPYREDFIKQVVKRMVSRDILRRTKRVYLTKGDSNRDIWSVFDVRSGIPRGEHIKTTRLADLGL